MPKDKKETYQRIIPAAKKEFLEKGFEKASMRNIAAEAGITAAGLYRHFADKEAMFEELIAPVFEEFKDEYEIRKNRDYEFLENGNLDEMWSGDTDLAYFLDWIYRYFDEFKLILCCSDGTKYANFIHDLCVYEQDETLAYMEAARKKGIPVKEVKPQELHLLLSAYYSAVFEVVIHDFPREDAEHYLDTLQRFFYPGWRNVLGL